VIKGFVGEGRGWRPMYLKRKAADILGALLSKEERSNVYSRLHFQGLVAFII
jgi:hypothetical protein